MGSPWQQAAGGDATLTTIHLLEPERAIADTPGRFVLLAQGDATTRLLLRESLGRSDPGRGLGGRGRPSFRATTALFPCSFGLGSASTLWADHSR
jgi:hypothetical protein